MIAPGLIWSGYGVERDKATKLLAFIRTNWAWFGSGKMIEPYESQAVERLAKELRSLAEEQ